MTIGKIPHINAATLAELNKQWVPEPASLKISNTPTGGFTRYSSLHASPVAHSAAAMAPNAVPTEPLYGVARLEQLRLQPHGGLAEMNDGKAIKTDVLAGLGYGVEGLSMLVGGLPFVAGTTGAKAAVLGTLGKVVTFASEAKNAVTFIHGAGQTALGRNLNFLDWVSLVAGGKGASSMKVVKDVANLRNGAQARVAAGAKGIAETSTQIKQLETYRDTLDQARGLAINLKKLDPASADYRHALSQYNNAMNSMAKQAKEINAALPKGERGARESLLFDMAAFNPKSVVNLIENEISAIAPQVRNLNATLEFHQGVHHSAAAASKTAEAAAKILGL